ncbi:hypothetical protein [Ectopseudomonas khazarica]|uniref:hypothetical protein n=1 Tax=Ectopseudomonas khazarica TaxID=2502979 RepID=UPI0037C5BF26
MFTRKRRPLATNTFNVDQGRDRLHTRRRSLRLKPSTSTLVGQSKSISMLLALSNAAPHEMRAVSFDMAVAAL